MILNTKNKILLAILLMLTSLLSAQLATPHATVEVTVKPEAKQSSISNEIRAKQFDPRAQILADYFAQYNSPLQYHAQDFIDAADTFDVDWKLAPAISGVESTFGKHSFGYNAWGWGIYGNQTLGFSSWRHGIFTVTEGLRKNYIDKGLTNPYSINIVYAASPAWGWKVNFFIKDLEAFSKKYPTQIQIKDQVSTAASSAEVASK